MKKWTIWAALVAVAFGFSDKISPDPNDLYIQNLNENQARLKARQALKRSLPKSSALSPRSSVNPENDYNREFERFSEEEEKNKLYYRNIIKQRSKRDPGTYHFSTVRKSSDTKKAGVVVKSGHHREVYNYTEVKGVVASSFKKMSGEDEENAGVLVKKGAKVDRITNFVEVRNSRIGSELNTGVKVEDPEAPEEVTNDVTLENSHIGE
ncbi:MAG: hypothetical protein GXO33_01865 [Epsilonproteobacteria bacterium]|nr:hypothetical protein [Campylobacterota bacterium]